MPVRPPYLKKGDLVGITAPARWVNPEDICFFMGILEDKGYRPLTGPVNRKHNQFAGNDTARLADLQSMFDNPAIRAVFCARGGYGSLRILKDLDLTEFAESPKWLVGFSDITTLHSMLYVRLGCESVHAGMPYSFRGVSDPGNPGIVSIFNILKGEIPGYRVNPHGLNRPGQAEGILLGGNLSVLYSLTGTPWQPDTRDAILFLEDVDEYLYHIDRMMQNLKLAGMLARLKGLVIGGMTDMHNNEIPFGKDAYRIILDTVYEYGYPVLFDFPAGHRDPNLALVLGRKCRITVDEREGRLVFLN